MKQPTTKLNRLAVASALAIAVCGGLLYELIAFADKTSRSSHAVTQPHAVKEQILAKRISINLADTTELQSIKGIGVKLAQRIVHHRETHGAFESLEDLARVKGISMRLVDQNKDLLDL